MKLNYELIYKVRSLEFPTGSLNDLKWKYHTEADKKAEEEHKKYTDFIENNIAGTSTHDYHISDCMCLADGISRHVYVGSKGSTKGVGHRKCVFCGCDDDTFF